jgi:hypothetical protein
MLEERWATDLSSNTSIIHAYGGEDESKQSSGCSRWMQGERERERERERAQRNIKY